MQGLSTTTTFKVLQSMGFYEDLNQKIKGEYERRMDQARSAHAAPYTHYYLLGRVRHDFKVLNAFHIRAMRRHAHQQAKDKRKLKTALLGGVILLALSTPLALVFDALWSGSITSSLVPQMVTVGWRYGISALLSYGPATALAQRAMNRFSPEKPVGMRKQMKPTLDLMRSFNQRVQTEMIALEEQHTEALVKASDALVAMNPRLAVRLRKVHSLYALRQQEEIEKRQRAQQNELATIHAGITVPTVDYKKLALRPPRRAS